MKCTINKQEEYLMILLVSMQINNDPKLSYTEELGMRLFNLDFNSLEFECKLNDEERDALEYVDTVYRYEELKEEITTFRKAAERLGYDYEYTEEEISY